MKHHIKYRAYQVNIFKKVATKDNHFVTDFVKTDFFTSRKFNIFLKKSIEKGWTHSWIPNWESASIIENKSRVYEIFPIR